MKFSQVRRAQACVVAAILVLAGFLGGVLYSAYGDSEGSSRYNPDQVDVGFAREMTLHHRQAVDMASLSVVYGESAEVKELAFDILKSQQDQIGKMTGWLQSWDESVIARPPYMEWMGMSTQPTSGIEGRLMPGMASDREMTNLRDFRGPQNDILFLKLMLRHHQGGLHMMSYGAANVKYGPLRGLAQSMLSTQSAEIELLSRMLKERNEQPLTMN